jgi:phosphatidylglycerophosphate synthase
MAKHKNPSRKNLFEWFYNILAKAITPAFLKTPLTANHVTLISGMFGIVGSILLLSDQYLHLLLAGISINIFAVLDLVDGNIARTKNMCSVYGQWHDVFFDKLNDILIILGLAIGVYFRTNDPFSLILGMFLMGFIYYIQFVMVYVNQVLWPKLTEKEVAEKDVQAIEKEPKIEQKESRGLIKSITKFILKHLLCGHSPFLLIVSIFAIIDQLYLGLIVLTIHTGFSFLFMSLVNFYAIKLKESEK